MSGGRRSPDYGPVLEARRQLAAELAPATGAAVARIQG